MKDSICEALVQLGFKILKSDDGIISGEVESFNNGVFDILVQLKDKTFSVVLRERFSQMNIFTMQRYESAESIVALLKDNYPFDEFVIDNDGAFEKLFKERMMTSDLLSPGESWHSTPL